MELAIKKMGNSYGVILPKRALQSVGVVDGAGVACLDVQADRLILEVKKASENPREGWAQAAQKIALAGDDALILGDFDNKADEGWQW